MKTLPRSAAAALVTSGSEHRRLRLVLAFLVFLALTAAWLAPMFFHFTSTVLSGPADGTLGIRGYWATQAQHGTPFTLTRDSLIDAPEGLPYLRAISYAEPAQPGIVWLLHPLFGFIGAFNVFLIAGFVLTGFVAFALLDRLGFRPITCFFGGYVVAFNPWCFERAFGGHAAFLHVWIQIALVFALLRMSERRRIRDAALAGAAFGGSFWIADYFGLLASVVIVLYFIYEGVRVKEATERLWTATLACSAFGTFAVFLLPGYAAYRRDHSVVSTSISSVASEAQGGGADTLAYFRPDQHHPLFGHPTHSHLQSVIASEHTVFFGYTTIVLAAFGLAMVIRGHPATFAPRIRRTALVFAAILLPVAYWASLRRIVHPFGIPVPALSFFVGHVTSFYRVYARFGIIVAIALVLLAAVAFDGIAARGRRGILVCFALLGLLAFELLPGGVTAWAAKSPPDYDRWFATQPAGIVAHYPLPTDQEPANLLGLREIYFQIYAHHPLYNILGAGTGNTREAAIRTLTRYVTDPLTPGILAGEHVRWVVLHDDVYRQERAAPPALGPPFYLVKRFPNVRIYTLRGVPPANVDQLLEQNAASIALVQGLVAPTAREVRGFSAAPASGAREAVSGATWSLQNKDVNLKRVQVLVTASAQQTTTLRLFDAAGNDLAHSAITSTPTRIILGPFAVPQGTFSVVLRSDDGSSATLGAAQFQPLSDFSASLRAPS